ncbi:hypothetical protein ASG17_13560 [Brevundimonas sp. Leaf363]|uniref:CopG family ribbon-helix-helix protein n=1 Tax=Brevundimonas sp. Leaf363 TaxID=1736353 RepID=UPI0006FE40DA|nr:hypothetical protein [Brevundimonas sp. Leaf363]KQS53975.1 hypothetical protein ASG17_13560 [Brevundimonas sp. Leaf363]
MTVHVTIEIDEAVKAKLDALSISRGRPSGDLLVEAAERIASEQDALDAAIAEAEGSLAAGEGIPHEEVVARLLARRARWTAAA